MPNTESAKKRVRVTRKKRARNLAVRSQAKTVVSKAEELVFAGKLKKAKEAVTGAISSLDRAAQKGVIHPNNAARRKSRLMKKLNEAQAESSAK